jgi:hypothetical protein
MRLFRFHRSDGSSSIASRAIGTAAVLLIALLVYLAADPEAHERFHHDADESDHHCVVTEFAAGEALVLTVALVVQPLVLRFVRIHWVQIPALHATVDLLLQPSCGPPFAARRA